VAALPEPSAGLAFCVLLFVPEVAEPLVSLPPVATGFCSVVVGLAHRERRRGTIEFWTGGRAERYRRR
jgi:hypothetical protein